jgi:hypothetical protein
MRGPYICFYKKNLKRDRKESQTPDNEKDGIGNRKPPPVIPAVVPLESKSCRRIKMVTKSNLFRGLPEIDCKEKAEYC